MCEHHVGAAGTGDRWNRPGKYHHSPLAGLAAGASELAGELQLLSPLPGQVMWADRLGRPGMYTEAEHDSENPARVLTWMILTPVC